MTMNEELREAYLEILNSIDDKYLTPHNELSGIFLTSIHPDYEKAKNKIIIVGRETKSRKWNEGEDFDSKNREKCVDQALDSHLRFFKKQLEKTGNSKGRSFHNFSRKVGEKSGKDGLIYSNLFCYSFKKTIPTKSPNFEEILILSEKLLHAQIRILKPDIILFMNGFHKKSIAARRKFFPIEGENNVCINSKEYKDEGPDNKQLWSFDLKFGDQLIKCYRSYHPSAVLKKAKKGHEYLIDLMPGK